MVVHGLSLVTPSSSSASSTLSIVWPGLQKISNDYHELYHICSAEYRDGGDAFHSYVGIASKGNDISGIQLQVRNHAVTCI